MPPLQSKKTEAGLRVRKFLSSMQVTENLDSDIQLLEKEQKKARKGRNSRYTKKTGNKHAKLYVQDFEDDDVHQFVGHDFQRLSRQKKRATLLSLIRLLDKTAAALSAIGGREEVEELFQAIGLEDEEAAGRIRQHCSTIFDLLPRSSPVSEASPDEVPSTIDLYDQSFIYRASSRVLYLLRPVEVFKGNINYNRRKVFGYVRSQDCSQPLMCALPGWTKCVEKHPRLLDPKLWTNVVKDLVGFHNYEFKKSPFDNHHGRDDGDTYATHVEPRLMIWFALDILRKMTGKTQTPLTQIGDLWRLRQTVQETIEAQIVLSRPPCGECLMFQNFMEAYTPIRFMFIVCKNLAEVALQKNKHNQKSLPLFAHDIEDSESELELEPQLVAKNAKALPQSRVAVVIRQRSSTSSISANARSVENQTTSAEVSFSTTMTPKDISGSGLSTKITVSQGSRLQQDYHTPDSTEQKTTTRRRRYWNESGDKEWTPPARSKSKPRNRNMSTPVKKVTRNVILTPDSTPFDSDAWERAQKILHKRKFSGERENSANFAKKGRLCKL
jgi:hypothetical protein